jgi:hypothetical protein
MMDTLQREKLETLDGSRATDARDRAAVRIQDLAAVLEVSAAITAAPSLAAPTKAEFDRLVADVQMLHSALFSISAALQARLT